MNSLFNKYLEAVNSFDLEKAITKELVLENLTDSNFNKLFNKAVVKIKKDHDNLSVEKIEDIREKLKKKLVKN